MTIYQVEGEQTEIKKYLEELATHTNENDHNMFFVKSSHLLITVDRLQQAHEASNNPKEIINIVDNVYISLETINSEQLRKIMENEGDLNLVFEQIVSLVQPILD